MHCPNTYATHGIWLAIALIVQNGYSINRVSLEDFFFCSLLSGSELLEADLELTIPEHSLHSTSGAHQVLIKPNVAVGVGLHPGGAIYGEG